MCVFALLLEFVDALFTWYLSVLPWQDEFPAEISTRLLTAAVHKNFCCGQLFWASIFTQSFPSFLSLLGNKQTGLCVNVNVGFNFHLAEKTPHRTSGKKTNTCVPLTGWCKLRERTHRKPSRLTDKSKASAENFVVNTLIRTAFISLNWSKFIQTANIKFLVESMCVYVCVKHFSGCVPRKQTVVKRR